MSLRRLTAKEVYFWGRPDIVKACETDPMGQDSLLAVFASGGLTFRLRPGFANFSDFSNPSMF